jgi:hypothetical protein
LFESEFLSDPGDGKVAAENKSKHGAKPTESFPNRAEETAA